MKEIQSNTMFAQTPLLNDKFPGNVYIVSISIHVLIYSYDSKQATRIDRDKFHLGEEVLSNVGIWVYLKYTQ